MMNYKLPMPMFPQKAALKLLPLLTCISLFCQQAAFARPSTRAMPDYVVYADTIPANCPKYDEIVKIIEEAISLGAPIYNEGMHMACYRIYEWAGYKVLYEYGKLCPEIEKTMKTAIDKSHGDFSDTEKAWIMRMAFDKILGKPTETGSPEKDPAIRKG
jgi:hypothetical protein